MCDVEDMGLRVLVAAFLAARMDSMEKFGIHKVETIGGACIMWRVLAAQRCDVAGADVVGVACVMLRGIGCCLSCSKNDCVARATMWVVCPDLVHQDHGLMRGGGGAVLDRPAL